MQFKDVLVDDVLKMKLVDMVHNGRAAHAQLFLATPGNHAFALAVALGQYLSCENPSETDSCGECPSCRQYAQLAHPDLHIYFPNSGTTKVKSDTNCSPLFMNEFRDFAIKSDFHIDIQDWTKIFGGDNKQLSINVRDCADIIHYNGMRSFQDGYKVYILWCADKLHHTAAPKLLKTLEEPEPNSLFILISENQDKLLNTILSRTQLVKIPQLTTSLIEKKLQVTYPDMPMQAISDVAVLAEGNYNKAIRIISDDSEQKQMLEIFSTFFDSAIAFSRKKSLTEINYNLVQETIKEVIAKNGREYQKQLLTFFLRILRNILVLNTNNPQLLKVTHEEQSALSKYVGVLQLKQISTMTELCNTALYHISRNCNANIVFTDLYFQLAKAAL